MRSIFYPFLGLLLFCAGGNLLNAQPDLKTRERSIETIRRGVALHEEKKYDDAVAEFKKVQRNDSNFYLASVEILTTYLATGKNEEGLALCNHLLKLKNNYTPNVLIYKADFLDNLKRSDEAQRVYEQGIKDYPLNHSFYYEMAVLKLNQKKYDEAYPLLIKTLHLNPFHASSHYHMGLMAYRSGNVTATMLALQFYFLCDPSSKRAQGIVSDLEKIAKMELEIDTVVNTKAFTDQNDFVELESILKSKVALGDKYKSKTDLDYSLTKQMQVVIENIGKYKDVKGFYNEFYGKFFADLYAAKFLEPYAYYSLKGMEIEKVNKWILKNKEEVNKFETWCYYYLCKTLANYPENLNGQISSVPHWFNDNLITAAGVYNAQEKNEGYWNYYYNNGIKKSEGNYLNGIKTGTWKYYYNTGGLKEENSYNNGAETLYRSYFNNNNPSVEVAIANNKMNGVKKSYFSNGNIGSSTEYKDGIINGTQSYYYRNGSLRYTINNKNDILNGDLVEYFDNGKIYQTVKFLNSNREGPYKLFWNNEGNSLETEGTYKQNKKTGTWKNYYSSGKLERQAFYSESGLLEGEVKELYENGKIQTLDLYADGKLNGLCKDYADDGILSEETLYKKGKLLEYRAYKKDGSLICDNRINGKNFQLVFYHPNGIKRREGKVSDGQLEGAWKDYSSFGVLLKETNYKEGLFDGKYLEYHSTGKIKKDRSFVNDVEDGYYTSYFINGTIETEGMMVNGNNEGYWKSYHKDGSLETINYYVEGDLEGWTENYDVNARLATEDLYSETCLIKVVYHDTSGAVFQNIDLPGGTGFLEKKTAQGKVIFEKHFVKDYPDGLSKSYFPDGKTETSIEFKMGKREGKFLTYSSLGPVLIETPYFNNKKNGKEIVYFENGKIESEFNFLNGEYDGEGKAYFENGKLYKSLHYTDGDVEGESDVYDDSGELIYRRIFHKDLLVGYTYKDAAGLLLKPMGVGPGDVKLNCLFQNGKKSIDAIYTNGDLNGKRTLYYSNGKIMDEVEMYHGFDHGLAKKYYSNGNLKSLDHHYYGDLEGKSESYYENGKLKTEFNYRHGVEHGWFNYYDISGKLIKSILYYNGDPLVVK